MSECCLLFCCKSEKHFRSEYEQIAARSGKIFHKTEELRTVTSQICVLSLEIQHISIYKRWSQRVLDNGWEKTIRATGRQIWKVCSVAWRGWRQTWTSNSSVSGRRPKAPAAHLHQGLLYQQVNVPYFSLSQKDWAYLK